MSIRRRQVLQSATLLLLLASIPGMVHAQVAPLSVGVNRNIVAFNQYVGVPQNAYFDLGLAYLYTYGAAGVFIDVVPQPVSGHVGVCFNAAPNTSGAWQPLSAGPGQPMTQEFWYRGVGVIFHPDGRIQSEQWVIGPDGKSMPANVYDLGTYPGNTVLRVTGTTDASTGKTDIAVYSLNGSGGVVALLGSVTLYASPIGDRAGVFVIGSGNVQVQPYAIYP